MASTVIVYSLKNRCMENFNNLDVALSAVRTGLTGICCKKSRISVSAF